MMPFLPAADGSDAGSSGWGQLRKRRHVALIGSALIDRSHSRTRVRVGGPVPWITSVRRC